MTHALASADTPFRDDEVRPSLSSEEALSNAPAREGTCFQVPRILE
jgi:Asp-tRNA(Asn)/Glu-tRNA(Gln) amidotransferase C subunit